MTDGPHHQKEEILKCWKSFFLASSNQSCKRKRFYLVPCCTFADNLTLWFGLIILSNTFFLLLCICIKCLDFCWFIFKTFERYISTLKTLTLKTFSLLGKEKIQKTNPFAQAFSNEESQPEVNKNNTYFAVKVARRECLEILLFMMNLWKR